MVRLQAVGQAILFALWMEGLRAREGTGLPQSDVAKRRRAAARNHLSAPESGAVPGAPPDLTAPQGPGVVVLIPAGRVCTPRGTGSVSLLYTQTPCESLDFISAGVGNPVYCLASKIKSLKEHPVCFRTCSD